MAGHDAATEPWPPEAWLHTDADGQAALVGGWSATSGRAHFPPGLLCPWSGADDVEHRLLPRTGTLFAWTAVTAPPPGYEGEVPYGFGIVELSGPELEGSILRVVGRLTESDPTRLRFGQPMQVVVQDVASGQPIWAFAPVDAVNTTGGGTS